MHSHLQTATSTSLLCNWQHPCCCSSFHFAIMRSRNGCSWMAVNVPDFYHEKVLKPVHKGQMQQCEWELFWKIIVFHQIDTTFNVVMTYNLIFMKYISLLTAMDCAAALDNLQFKKRRNWSLIIIYRCSMVTPDLPVRWKTVHKIRNKSFYNQHKLSTRR